MPAEAAESDFPYEIGAGLRADGAEPCFVLVDIHWLCQWQQKALAMDKKDSLFKVDEGFANQHQLNKEVFQMEKDISSLEHTRWRCQCHIVYAPKYRRMAIYGEIKKDIGFILRKLCEQTDVIMGIRQCHFSRSYCSRALGRV